MNGSKELSDLLRVYFYSLSNRVALELDIFDNVRFMYSKDDSIKKLIVEESLKCIEARDGEQESAIQQFLDKKLNEFEINASGLCKYCNLFNLNLASFDVDNLEAFLDSIISEYNNYCKIVTSLILDDRTQHHSNEKMRSFRFSVKFLKKFPNLRNIYVRNIQIDDIESKALACCPMLSNLELINNNMAHIPSCVFKDASKLTQFLVDSNPIQHLPTELFLNDSIRSLVLNNLNLLNLPDGWLASRIINTDESVNIRALNIFQTMLTDLPNDFLANNLILEQLIFQGVPLILPPDD